MKHFNGHLKILAIVFLSIVFNHSYADAQNLALSFANAELTTESSDTFYEVDILISSDTDFKMGDGLIFFDYNTAAFGENVASDPSNVDIGVTPSLTPEYILDQGVLALPSVAVYALASTNSTSSTLGISWSQSFGESSIPVDNVTSTAQKLFHLKLKLSNPSESPNISFNTGLGFTQVLTSCTDSGAPFGTCVGPGEEINQSDGGIATDSSGAALPFSCSGEIMTWDGTAWDTMTTPTIDDIVIINGDYNTATNDDITACTCQINTEHTVTISNGGFLNTFSDITVNGTLTVANGGSVVQQLEDAVTINNGSISVEKMTPDLEPTSFIDLSSPMSTETRTGVYNTAEHVFGIIPANFTPNTEVLNAINFIDDDGDYLEANVTDLEVGSGYIVFPQALTETEAMTYSHTYTSGTLNSGTITVPTTYNGPATANNFNLIGNPYASAIDADMFITQNSMVNSVYFWEHITPPNENLPGFNEGRNYSMDDVSIRNVMMGVPAMNGGTAPGQYIVSGQGFGILADQSALGTDVSFTNAMRVTGNNGTLRSSEQENRLWLRINSQTYTLQNILGIGFTPNATIGFDNGYDSPRLATTFGLFSVLETGEQLAIQGREVFNTSMEIPLGFATLIPESETYTILIDHLEGEEIENTGIYLIDHLLNTVTDLTVGAYEFVASEVIQENRFTVVFEERDPLNVDDNTLNAAISLFPNPALTQITLSYIGNQKLRNAVITDINGKIVKEVNLSDFKNSKSIDISTMASGLYFVKIEGQSDSTVKKLFIR